MFWPRRVTTATYVRVSIEDAEREREMFYLTTHSTHFIYGYMASHIWLRTILIVRKETRCRNIGYSYRLTARVLLYAPSHRQDNTYHGLCYTSRGALAGTRNSSMGPPHEGSIRRPIAPWTNALPLSYVPLTRRRRCQCTVKKHCDVIALWESDCYVIILAVNSYLVVVLAELIVVIYIVIAAKHYYCYYYYYY